jgi:hypothetical protein
MTGMRINLSTRQWGLVVLGILLVLYIIFQARFLIVGPQVSIHSPKDGEVVASEIVRVSGKALNIAWISLNGRQIFTDENGAWEETLLVSPGVSIMTVAVRDRFGRERQESARIIFNHGKN